MRPAVSVPEVEPEVAFERRRACRALLRHPLLPAGGATASQYRLVRRHSEWLRQWFSRFPAWNLQVDAEAARLYKFPGGPIDDTRPASDPRSGAPLTRRRYALLCLALAALEQSQRQTTLGELAQRIMEFAAADRELQAAGLVFDIAHHDQRRDLVQAIRVLLDTGVLRRRDGDERRFVERNERSAGEPESLAASDVLYDINRHILSAMLQGPHSPSGIATASDASAQHGAALCAEPAPVTVTVTEDEQQRTMRARLVRVLLDESILYYDDLADGERRYLERHRDPLLRQIREATGLIAEVRAEGIAMLAAIEDADDLTDVQLSDDSPGLAGGQAGVQRDSTRILQLVTWLAASCGIAIPLASVEAYIQGRVRAEPRWSDDALQRLRALRLIRISPDGVVPLPACGRYGRR